MGRPVYYRGGDLFNNDSLSVEEMFKADSLKLSKEQTLALYARGWALTHYLMMSGARQGELGRYINATQSGQNHLTAARDIFGDFKKLDSELKITSAQAV